MKFNLSPAARLAVSVLIAAGTAALTVLTDGFQPEDAIVIGLAGLGAFGVVPPQVGGTQQGVVSPDVIDLPPSDSIKRA